MVLYNYSLINAQGEIFKVKFHFKTLQGIQTITNKEAEAIVAKDRESNQRDFIWKKHSSWEIFQNGVLKFKVMTNEQAKIVVLIHLI